MIKINKITRGTLRRSEQKYWVTESPFVFEYFSDDGYHVIIIKEGLTTDFGSIPSLFHSFLSPIKYDSYILHDYLYTYKKVVDDGYIYEISRHQADLLLLKGLEYEGSGLLERYLIYLGVRLFGFLFY